MLVDLSFNQFSQLANELFHPLQTLEKLCLIGNKIEKLHAITFEKLENLSILKLDEKEIIQIDASLFKTLVNLEELHKIAQIDPQTFQQMHKLLYLNSRNQSTESFEFKLI